MKTSNNQNNKLKLFAGIGLGVIGLGTTYYIIYKKKKAQQEPSIVSSSVKAIESNVKGKFINYFGKSSFLSNYVRGVRNNNPGNIIKTKIDWQYKIPNDKNTDGHFEQFYTYKGGLRALILNLKSYYKKGYRTISQIIGKWSPPSENNTGQYIKHVAKYTGIPEQMPITWDKKTIQKITEAIIISENGKLYLNQMDFDWAWLQAN